MKTTFPPIVTPPLFAVQKSTQVMADGTRFSFITAVDYTLDPKDINPGDRSITLAVDTLTIDGNGSEVALALPSVGLTICARQVVLKSNLGIDVSGANNPSILPMNPPQASAGATAGAAGANGLPATATAADGNPGGGLAIWTGAIVVPTSSATFTATANGGQGQSGQNGQIGGDGAAGATGPDDQYSSANYRIDPGGPGGNGGAGGSGGSAGQPGNGGFSGEVFVGVLSAQAAGLTLVPTAQPGPAGQPGTAGAGGRGSAGGNGGQIGQLTYVDEPMGGPVPDGMDFTGTYYQRGSDGIAGQPGAASPAAASGKVVGIAEVYFNTTKSFGLTTYMLPFFHLLVQYAELAYLEGNTALAISYYEWTKNFAPSGGTPPNDLELEYSSLQKYCAGMLEQIKQGLDFFGNPLNQVPLVNLSDYTTSLDTMLAAGNAMETVFNQYVLCLQNQQATFANLDDAIASAQAALTAEQTEAAALATRITTDLPAALELLASELATQYTILLQSDQAFQTAVANQGVKCTFQNILDLTKTLVSLGKDAFSTFTDPSIGGVMATLGDMGSVQADMQNFMEYPTPVSGGPTDIATAWQKLQAGGQVNDQSKLLLAQQDFDAALQPFLSLPAAAAYVHKMHDYIGTAQSRNAKLMDYTTSCIKYSNLLASMQVRTAHIAAIKQQEAIENNPGLSIYRNFMYAEHQNYLNKCLKYLYQENQAYNYWSCSENDFVITDYSFTGLSAFHSSLKGKILDRLNTVGKPSQPLNRTLSLMPADRPEMFKQFGESNRFTFQLNPATDQTFQGWVSVLLTNFTIVVQGATIPSNGLYLSLYHHGDAVVLDPAGAPHKFTHDTIKAVYQYGGNQGPSGGAFGGNPEGQNQDLIAVSPFATFTIEVPPAFNAGVSLVDVTGINITFTGYALPAPSPKAL